MNASLSFVVRQFRREDQEAAKQLWMDSLLSHTHSSELSSAIRRYIDVKTKEGKGSDMYDIASYYKTDAVTSSIMEGEKEVIKKNFFVAERLSDGKIIGTVAGLPATEFNATSHVELVRMSVDISARGSQVGSSLIEAFEKWAKEEAGYLYVTIAIYNLNYAAAKFYSKNGYHRIEKTDNPLPPSAYYISEEEAKVVNVLYFLKEL
jgi:N-acetylglutamate synthase-like GNAT family acetyltransferase